MVEVPEGHTFPGARHAVFGAITAWVPAYAQYKGKLPSEKYRDQLFSCVLMSTARWDGRCGFIGGLVEGERTPFEQLQEEAWEEAGVESGTQGWQHLVTHATPKMVLACYYRDLGPITKYTFRSYLEHAARAPDALAEGMVTWMPLAVYPGGKGLPARLAAGNLPTAVREELVALYRVLAANAPARACDMPPVG